MKQQGKYGWYPCDWATYQKLKQLNMAYDKALQDKARWERWDRKEPQNRVSRARLRDSAGNIVGYAAPVPLAEPEVCPIFCKKVVKNVKWGKKGQYYKDGKDETFVEMVKLPIYEDYRKARYPVTEEQVLALSLSLDLINSFHDKLAENPTEFNVTINR